MSSTQLWVGMLVPPLIKWISPYLKKFFKLDEFDTQTKERISIKIYPAYFGVLYDIYVVTQIGVAIAVFLLIGIFLPNVLPEIGFGTSFLIGFLNMFGALMILGGFIDIITFRLSSENFKDYIKMKQLKLGWGYDINQQIAIQFRIGFVYYLIIIPVMTYLIFR